MQTIKIANMVHEINKRFPLDEAIQKALLGIDREIFVPQGFITHAFSLDALPMDAKQWISSPLTIAKMTQYLEVKGADSVLEIGCGSGYQAVVLSRLIRRVFSIERIESLLQKARERIKICNISNINTKLDDGQKGWKTYAPYDRILFSASALEISKEIIEQLKENGILVAPIEKGDKQVITRWKKRGGILCDKEELESCVFVPVLDGIS